VDLIAELKDILDQMTAVRTPWTLLATSNACVRLAGLTATLIPYNAAVACYIGAIA